MKHRVTGREPHATATDRRRAMEAHRATLPKKRRRKRHAGRLPLCDRRVLTGIVFVLRSGIPWEMLPREAAALWHDVLAPSASVAAGTRLGSAAPSAARQAARCGRAGLFPGHRRQIFHTRRGRGKKSGPNPTDRRRPGSKHHLLTDAQGIPLSVILTGANRHDVTQLMPLVEAIPPVRGLRGAPKHKPALVQADRAYDSNPLRALLAQRGIDTQIARRRTPHGSGLGKTRWVVERTISWLHQFRQLCIRFERLPSIHEAFLKLGCCLICWRSLRVV